MKTLYLARVKGLPSPSQKSWVTFDGQNTMYNIARLSKKEALEMWVQNYGPYTRLIQYKGILRYSELIVTIASVREKITEEEKNGGDTNRKSS